MYLPKLPTLKDINIRGRRVFMRIDINVPIDPETGEILDDRRIRVHAKYVKSIVEEYSPALVLGSHQGRPGSLDFTTLEKHRELLEKYSGLEVKFVSDVVGPTALNAIKSLKPGEVLLLDNLRLMSEEVLEAPPEACSLSIFAKRIASAVDFYVNDAFASAHRSQPSIVGLPLLLPSAIGPVFESEVRALSKVISDSEPPRVFVLGGKKVAEHMRVIENLTKNRLADRILTCGLLGLLFLAAKGVNIGEENYRLLEENGLTPYIPRARYLLMRGAPVETPVDFKVQLRDGKVEDAYIGQLRGRVCDIGEHTAGIYADLVKEARVVVMRGPAGVIEVEEFRKGTLKLLEAAYSSKGFVLIAGGHLAMLVKEEHTDRVHVSTGGNAVLLFLSGEELPALKAMELSARMFLGW